jgi:hypothetical protein
MRDDPIGVLLPAVVVVGSQALVIAALQATWRDLTPLALTGVVAAAIVGRVAVAAPFRALSLASAANQLQRPFSSIARAPALAAVWAVGALVEAVVVGALLSATLAPAWWLASRAAWWSALLIVIATALPILLAGVATRVVFAYAAIEATAGRRSAPAALVHGARTALSDGPGVLLVLLVGEAFTALGGLLCGAGTLPGASYADLALLHRWAHRRETS